ncbi:hypothetical protein SprV_0802465900 [Sparganum proliferum]
MKYRKDFRQDNNRRYDVGPKENCPVVEGSETAGTHDGSAGCEMEISRDAERAVAADSHGEIDAEHSKRSKCAYHLQSALNLPLSN